MPASRNINLETRITDKVVLLTSFAMLTFIIGILLLGPIIFVSAPVVAYLGLMILQVEKPHLKVEVRRTIEKAQIYESDELGIRVKVTNVGEKSIPTLEIRDHYPEEFELVSSSTTALVSLRPGESAEYFYTLRAKSYGIPRIGPVKLRSLDQQGFFETLATQDVFSSVVVFPFTSERLQHLKIRPRKIKSWPGEILAKRIGFGMDYYSLRPFIPGDSFRTVNWRASARTPSSSQLIVNEYMAELGTDTMVIVDGRAIADVGRKPNSALSYSIHAAIAISDRLLRDRNRVGLVTLGDRGERIAPGYGRRQHNRMVLSMLRIKSGETWTIENLSRYLQFFFPDLALIVFVSTLADESSIVSAVELARLGYDLVVVSPNPLDFGVEDNNKSSRRFLRKAVRSKKILKIASDLAEIKRSASIRELHRANAIVVDWHVSESLESAMEINLRAWNRTAGLNRVAGK